MDEDQANAPDTGAMLLALTRFISHWTSLEFQRSVMLSRSVRLDPTAVRALYILGREGGTATPSAIAEATHLSRPSTSKLLARLADSGLLLRSTQEQDRRSVTVTLTALGQSTFDELFAAGMAMIDAATRDWTPADRGHLNRLLPRFIAALTQTPPQ
ncbi:DNA-binding MarR family transcriptional regulator [Leucobacter luti]|uniref:DNA-binding MarR family transcriptional regulator n=1 Tax=Leucobacter luti TaxID=340320 RepID=A0A4R6S8K2_9MICO|nr:MarR family transcriptional regulator [Leucobacter luti]TDP95724.1 DNA-binding MarR family transcriptional regulator [Leucobacter luti]